MIKLIELLLLAAPTSFWGCSGRHNSPPGSSVIDIIFRHSDGSHVSVEVSFWFPRNMFVVCSM